MAEQSKRKQDGKGERAGKAPSKAEGKAKGAVKRPAKDGAKPRTAKDRIEVRESGVHGKGVYAIAPIAAGERIIEYKGERISWDTALERHPHDPNDPNHTFYFSLEDGDVLDAKYGGNRSRWIEPVNVTSPLLTVPCTSGKSLVASFTPWRKSSSPATSTGAVDVVGACVVVVVVSAFASSFFPLQAVANMASATTNGRIFCFINIYFNG